MPSESLTQHWRKSYEGKYLGAWDLWSSKLNRYLEVTARIDAVTDDEVVGEGGRRSRPIQLWLSGSKGPIKTPFILSKSNGTTLQVMTGTPVPAKWVGTTITLYVRKAKRVQKGTGDVLTIRNTRGSRDLAQDLREELEPHGPAIPEDELQDPGGPDAETH